LIELSAPLYIAWQLTNECNLACLHCIEGSGPGRAFPDELGREECLRLAREMVREAVPYVAFSGGEPMTHPAFFDLARTLCVGGAAVKVETNGHFLTPEACGRLAAMGVHSVQVSLDGVSEEAYRKLRARGSLGTVLAGLRELRSAGVPFEVNFCPTRFNVGEIREAVDLAFELGAGGFYTGRTMYTGNAVAAWGRIAPSEEQYRDFFRAVQEKASAYKGRMRVRYHELGLLEELRYRLRHPAALFIILPNGLVKLINALPFVCGDLRRESLREVWAAFRRSWKSPQVRAFVEAMETEPELTSRLHDRVALTA
jgi:MoaA/NifB/PqqE/SkfB family radical SAM enzyme